MTCTYPADPGDYLQPPARCGDETYGGEFCPAHMAVEYGDPDQQERDHENR